MNDIEKLRQNVTDMESAYLAVRKRLELSMPGVDVFTVIDTSGRHILLDSLTVLVSARTVLLQAEQNANR